MKGRGMPMLDGCFLGTTAVAAVLMILSYMLQSQVLTMISAGFICLFVLLFIIEAARALREIG